MAQSKRQLRKVFDPRIGDLAAECETTSERVRAKLNDPISWCFCELCGEVTEFALATSERARGFYKRNGEAVPMSQTISAQAEKIADAAANRFALALTGDGPDSPIQLIIEYCGIDGFRNLKSDELRDRDGQDETGYISVEQFRLQVEGQARMALWAKRSDFIGAKPHPKPGNARADLAQKSSRAGEPSRLYCERHNQRRSDDARRAYQRDVEQVGEYHALINEIWSIKAGQWPTWDIKAHAHVRKEAYRLLQESKPTITRISAEMIDALTSRGITNQSEIARQLGVSRQAVSAALKRRKGMNTNPVT